jgi:hypothetical protein
MATRRASLAVAMTLDSVGTEQGIGGDLLENRPLRRDNRHENIREFSGLRDDEPQIPYATE